MPRPPHTPPLTDLAPTFALFWESSKLNRRTARDFAARLDSDGRQSQVAPQLHYPAAPLALPPADRRLVTQLAQRRTERTFGHRPLGAVELGTLLGAVGEHDGHRLLPSAGGTYPLETFVLAWAADAPFGGQVLYLDPGQHAVLPVAPLPPWESLADAVGIDQAPAAIVLFVAIPQRILRRYGDRGGRFLLLEAGHLAQNVLLAAAHLGLHALPLGGLHDDFMQTLVGLPSAEAQVVYGCAVGHPA